LENIINWEPYIATVHEIFGHVTEGDIGEAWFQQDSEPCHAAQVTTS
jgi:hypothetical protein